MKRLTTWLLAGAAGAMASFGFASVAAALWSTGSAVQPAPLRLGTVSFAAFGQSGTTTPQYSPDGGPVTLTLPGAEIVKVLDQVGPDPAPVIWRFTAQGDAQGITGLIYSVTLGAQIAPDGSVTDLSAGVARPGTLLALSTTLIYPAALNGDCSAVPAVPADPADVHLIDATNHRLQAAGASTGTPSQQVWCVALRFNADPDGAYANEVQVTATGQDGAHYGALDRWRAAVVFPPSLEPIGPYRNRADVIGLADDGTWARASVLYSALVYPDPTREPAVTLLLDPSVTNLNPAVPPGDHVSVTPTG